MSAGPAAADVTIVGAGIVGICSALALLARGYRVELIDREPPASGASHGNAGVISPWTCVPQSMPGLWKKVPRWVLDDAGPVSIRTRYLPRFAPWAWRFLRAGQRHRLAAIGDALFALNEPSLALYRQLLQDTGQGQLIVDACYLHAFRNAADADANSLGWQMRTQRGVPYERISGTEARQMEPALSPAIAAAMVIQRQGRARDPGAVGTALFDKALATGASFRRAAVSAISADSSGGWLVHLQADQPRRASRLLIAAGAWSARLLRPLGLRLPLQSERGYHAVLADPGLELTHSVMDADHKFVASTMNTGLRVAGTAEFDRLDAPPDYRRAAMLQRLVADLLPDVRNDDAQHWMGSRPSFPDSLPVIGSVPGRRNLYAAFGHCHYGFGMAPNTGRVIAELIDGARPRLDLAPYRVDRFASKETGARE